VVHSACKVDLSRLDSGALHKRSLPKYNAICGTAAPYRLKQKYFIGVLTDQIRMTSPVSSMNDAQWCELVKIWSNAKNKICEPIDFLPSLAMVYLCCNLTQMKL
jgi:hypothetical protein